MVTARSVRRLEVLIDDEVVYRTEHDVLDWREATFRMRRLRPMPSTIVPVAHKREW